MIQRHTVWWSIVLFALTGMIDSAFCHDARGSMKSGSGIELHAEYDDGEPMAYSRIEVFHAEEERPFQSGATDRNGRFLFLPDSTGRWEITVCDGDGHVLVLETNLNEELPSLQSDTRQDKEDAGRTSSEVGSRKNGTSFPSHFQGAIVVTSLIFGMIGVYSLIVRWVERARHGVRSRQEKSGCTFPKE